MKLKENETIWYETDEGFWECEKCDIAWVFSAFEKPKDHDCNYCPKCGRKIIAAFEYAEYHEE